MVERSGGGVGGELGWVWIGPRRQESTAPGSDSRLAQCRGEGLGAGESS